METSYIMFANLIRLFKKNHTELRTIHIIYNYRPCFYVRT